MDKILADLLTLGMMLRDYISGRYRNVPWWLIASVVFAGLYVISPLDLIPDCIPVLGQLDDVAVVVLCLKSMAAELEKYRQWRRG